MGEDSSSPSVSELETTKEVRTAVELGRRLLFSALDSLDGEKTIVWDRDRTIMHRVNLFAGASALAAHGVVANHSIESQLVVSTTQVVFFLAPTAPSLELLCEYIDNVRNDPKTLYQVFFIPEAWYVVREKLKERSSGRYWERLESVREIALSWLPRDGECLSLSIPSLPSSLLLNGDWTYLHKCTVALNQLIELCDSATRHASHGPRVAVYSRGKWANDIARMLKKFRNNPTESSVPPAPANTDSTLKINRIVIIDRWLDPLTPLLTQLTYAGLLDEMYQVGMVNSIKVSQEEFDGKEGPDPFAQKEIYLTDEIYHRLKHIHANGVGLEMAAILEELRKDENYDKDNMSVAEYAVLVRKMPRILKRKNLSNMHMRLAEIAHKYLYKTLSEVVVVEKELLESSDGDKPLPYIEEQIYDATDLSRVLRLIAVHSLTAGGLKPAVLNVYRRTITQSYGVSALNKLLKMQKMGLVREKSGSGKLSCEYAPLLYPQMKKQYNLLPPNVSETAMNDAAYTYSGFAPLLVRILEEGDRLRWAGWTRATFGNNGDDTPDSPYSEDDATLVFVVGGVTRAEMAAIRRRLPNVALLATTAVINGNRLLDSITNI